MSTKLKAGTATSGAVIDADTTGILELQSGSTPTTAVTIDASQNVGIGTSTPFQTAANRVVASINGSTSSILSMGSGGTQRAGLYTDSSQVQLYSVGALPLLFATDSTERMRIDSSGNVLINTSTTLAKLTTYSASGTIMVTQSGVTTGITQIAFANPNGYVGSITTSGSATAFNTSSDYRLKENIAPMTGALDKVALLKPVTYTWKADGSASEGFIAHELQEVVPDCVTGEKDAVNEDGSIKAQGIDTSFLVATLTAAIQEQQAMITALQADVAALKGAK